MDERVKSGLDYMLRMAVMGAIPEDTKKIAAWCSGGVDSSALLYYVHDMGFDVHAINVFFDVPNTRPHLFGTLLDYLDVGGSSHIMKLGDHFRLLPKALKQHTGQMTAFPTLMLFTARMSMGYDLILHGLGLDELVGGYRQHSEAVDFLDFARVEDHYYDMLPETNRRTEIQAKALGLAIEAPFINDDLETFCRALPIRYKIEGGKTKIILRELMKGKIPDVNRLDGLVAGTKGGFHPPIREWWRRGLGKWSNERLSFWERRRTKGMLWHKIILANEKEKVALYG